MVREMNTDDFRAALKEGKTLVADFWAAWCGPCRMLGPVLDALSEDYGEKADFVRE
ncbi:MAG: thioredoxin family protein [Candidatus Borkfalkia sp.]